MFRIAHMLFTIGALEPLFFHFFLVLVQAVFSHNAPFICRVVAAEIALKAPALFRFGAHSVAHVRSQNFLGGVPHVAQRAFEPSVFDVLSVMLVIVLVKLVPGGTDLVAEGTRQIFLSGVGYVGVSFLGRLLLYAHARMGLHGADRLEH